jgi:curved DNA-binding protein CbpA
MMHLENLGLDNTATIDDIKSAYRRLAKMYHPDVYTGDNGEKFRELSASYEWLVRNHKQKQRIENCQSYYEFMDKQQTSVIIKVYDKGNELEKDTTIFLMRGMDEYRMSLKAGTKIPSKLRILNANPQIDVILEKR